MVRVLARRLTGYWSGMSESSEEFETGLISDEELPEDLRPGPGEGAEAGDVAETGESTPDDPLPEG